jgi:hypothetical protein
MDRLIESQIPRPRSRPRRVKNLVLKESSKKGLTDNQSAAAAETRRPMLMEITLFLRRSNRSTEKNFLSGLPTAPSRLLRC